MDGDAIYGGGLVNEGSLTLNNFTCNYNHVSIPPGGMGDAMGGCIFNTGNLSITGGHFLANTAGFGGAIYNYENATLIIEGSSFTGNEADTNGGALWNGVNSSTQISNSTLSQNQAGRGGGGIWNHGSVDGSNLLIEENQAILYGGGVHNWEGFAIFTNSWFTLNNAEAGGGLFNDAGMVHLYQSGLTENTTNAGAGAGILNIGSPAATGLLLKNVTVSNNTTPEGFGGAGIYSNANFDFQFVTIAGNSSQGLRVSNGTEIKIRSSILADNPGGDCLGITPDSLDYNIVGDGSCTLTGPHDLLGVDPLLEPLAANGGLAPSHALGIGSPAIDSGVPDLCIATDQNGTSRPQGAWCDRGAHENLAAPGTSSISGIVWHDLCAVPDSTPSTLPPGCITLPSSGLGADGIYDPAEPGIPNLQIQLFPGACFYGGASLVAETYTDSNGAYSIPGLAAGVYCAVVRSNYAPNESILIPGNWTYPERDADQAMLEVTLGESEALENINAGWDYQFLPASEKSVINYCVLAKNAFLRTGPSSADYPTVTGFLKGHLFEVLAISGPDRPGWFYGQDEAGFDGWIAQYLMDCKELDIGKLEVKKSPPVPIKTPTTIACTPELPLDLCIESGGTMSTTVTRAPYCICP